MLNEEEKIKNESEEEEQPKVEETESETKPNMEVNNGSEDAEAKTPMPEETNDLPEEGQEGSPENIEGEEKMLPQSEVNRLIGQARQAGRESALKELEAIKKQSSDEGRSSYINELFEKYGVSSEEELDGIFGKGQAYDSLNDDFNQQMSSMNGLKGEVALLKSNIDESRWDDVKFILGGQGLDVNSENIATMLPSHPEWLKGYAAGQVQQDVNPIKVLGNDVTNEEPVVETEEEQIKRLFSL